MAEIGGQEPRPQLNFIALHRNLIFKPGSWRAPGFLKLFLSGSQYVFVLACLPTGDEKLFM